MTFFTKQVQIALVAIAGITMLFFGVRFLKGMSLFSNDESYNITFKDVSGLSASSPIYADGFKVGTVKDIIYDFNHEQATTVVIGLDKGMRLTQGSAAEISSDMLGNVKVNIIVNTATKELLPPGSTISGRMSTGSLDKVSAMLPQIEKMMPKLDSILTSLNTLLADPSIARSLHNVETVTGNLTTTTSEVNKLMATLNKDVPGMMTKTNRILDNADHLTTNLTQIDIQKTMNDVDATVANLKEMTDKLNSNNGTLGKLMNDDVLYNNLNSTVRSADSLMTDLKQHPKRYVHFSIFGTKDK